MVTLLDLTPPIDRMTAAGELRLDKFGTCTFTWYTPTSPGVRPENSIGADALPMVTVGSVVVVLRDWLDAGEPVGG